MFKLDLTVMVLIDMQERLVPHIANIEKCNENIIRLLKAQAILNIPLIVTEQYPKGLGKTIKELRVFLNSATFVEKRTFSSFKEPNFYKKITKDLYKTVVLFGIESHVCVFQTALDAKKEGFDVILIADAISSRTEQNKKYAIDAMRQEGIKIFSTEMFLFMAVKDSKHPSFKEISKLLK